MRNRLMTLTVALLLASHAGMAQTPQAPQQPAPAPDAPALGTIDFGGLFGDADGDEARYERYRDTRDGVYSNLSFSKETGTYVLDAMASHVGYRDQRYAVDFNGSKVKFSFLWDSIPTNFSYLVATPWNTSGGTLTLDDGVQSAVQGQTNASSDGTAVGVPCAPGAPPASCANPALAALAKANRSAYNQLAAGFDMRQQRDAASFDLTYMATPAIDVDVRFTTTKKDGEQPWGAAFAFNNANELPLPLDNRTNDFSVAAAWANPKGMVKVGWDGSWFNNDIQTLVWDNPIRISDFNNGRLPPDGPYDGSGYSNGNGPAQGRIALAPSNSMNVFSATGLYKLPKRTSVNGTVQFTTQKQDEALIPWTINSVINTPEVFAAFPHIASLPRSTAEAEAKGINALLNLTSRPFRNVGFQVRYRYNERDNETPIFDSSEYVRFDAVPEEYCPPGSNPTDCPEGFSHQFDTTRQNFDANATFSLTGWGAVRVGYGHEAYERHGRGFSDVSENIFRVSYDVISSQYFSLRAAYDYGQRRGEGFTETGVDYEEGPGGTQPTLRYYDESDRDRTRGSLLVTVTPMDIVDVYVSYAGGKDEYKIDESAPVTRPDELFGLQDANVNSWNVGVNVRPRDTVGFGANYGRDDYSTLQRSRNASPPPDPTWDDPSRDWTLDNDETVNNFNLYVDLLRTIENTDIRFAYDFSDSDNAFVHGGPRIGSLSAAGQFVPLPNVENTWHRLTADLKYFFTPKAGVGFGYYYEKLDIVDFNTVDETGPNGFFAQTGDPRIDWLGGLVTGYGNRPYEGSTFFLRLLYLF